MKLLLKLRKLSINLKQNLILWISTKQKGAEAPLIICAEKSVARMLASYG